MSSPPEEQLLERAKKGDTEAFEALVELTRDRVFGVAFRMLRRESEAAEVTQETFLSAWKSLAQQSGDSFGHWVHRIAANKALMRLRHQRVVNQVEESLEPVQYTPRGSLAENVADWAPTGEGAMLDLELRQAIEKAADGLPESAREVFILHDIEGLDYQQISEITGDSVPALKSRLHRARLQMRSVINHHFEEKS